MRSKATAALVKYRKIVNVEDFESWTWDALVDAAQKATLMRTEIDEIVKTTYGDYIARLTMASAVKRGGIKEFCEEAGLNYGTVKNWRSQYLTAEQKREYRVKQPEPEECEEPATIVTMDDNSEDEAEPVFQDMFRKETRAASELEDDREPDEEENTAQFQKIMRLRTLLRARMESAIDNHSGEEIENITVYFANGGSMSVAGSREWQ